MCVLVRGQEHQVVMKQHLEQPIGEEGIAFSMIGEDDPTFRKVVGDVRQPEPAKLIALEDQKSYDKFLDDEDDAEILQNFKKDLNNEDINNKFKTDFAGDTFSQISSTFEPIPGGQQFGGGGLSQPPVILNRPNSSQAHNRSVNQDSQNARGLSAYNAVQKTSHKKQRPGQPKVYTELSQERALKNGAGLNMIISDNNVIDELLDSDILNASGLDDNLQSPDSYKFFEKPMMRRPQSRQQMNRFNQLQGSRDLGEGLSSRNVLGGGVLISNSENLLLMQNNQPTNQQNSTSTLTGFNSAIFDEASIMRVLDQTKSESAPTPQPYQNYQEPDPDFDENYFEGELSKFREPYKSNMGGRHYSRTQLREKAIKDELEEGLKNSQAIQELVKDKTRVAMKSNNAIISIEELKMLERQTLLANEKLNHLKSLGIALLHENEIKNVKMRQYRQNLKVKIHARLNRYKEMCRHQWKCADSRVFKYQLNEFDQNQRILQLEDKIERQQEELNKQANVCEQFRFSRKTIISQYDQRMNDIEKVLKQIIKSIQEENKAKISNSFCIGDHSMLLSQTPVVIQNVKNKYIINNHHGRGSAFANYSNNHNQQFNSSSLGSYAGTQGSHNRPRQMAAPQRDTKPEAPPQMNTFTNDQRERICKGMKSQNFNYQNKKSIKGQLMELKSMIKEFKEAHQKQQLVLDQDGSTYGNLMANGDQALDNMLSHVINIGAAVEQEDFSANTVDQAFIEQSNQIDEETSEREELEGEQIKEQANFNFGDLLNEIESKQDQRVDIKAANQELFDLMGLDDKITEKDLLQNKKKGAQILPIKGKNTNKFVQELYQFDEEIKLAEHSNNFRQDFSLEEPDLFQNRDHQHFGIKEQPNFFNSGEVQELSGIMNNLNQQLAERVSFVDTANNLSKELIVISQNVNQSLYSGGSSLIGLNYAFGAAPSSMIPENFVLKVQNREVLIPKIDINRVLSLEKRESFKNNLNNTNENGATFTASVLSQSISPQVKKTEQKMFGESISLIEQNSNILEKNLQETDVVLGAEEHSGNLENMFGDFQKELLQDDKNHHNQNDTLDLGGSNDFSSPSKIAPEGKDGIDVFSQKQSPGLFKKSLSDTNIIFENEDLVGNNQQIVQGFNDQNYLANANNNQVKERQTSSNYQIQSSGKSLNSGKPVSLNILSQASKEQLIKKVIPKGMKIKFSTAGQGIKPPSVEAKQPFDFHSVANAVQIDDRADNYAQLIQDGGKKADQSLALPIQESIRTHKRNLAFQKAQLIANEEVNENSKLQTELKLSQPVQNQRPESADNSCTPQKRPMIVVNKQIIKMPIKLQPPQGGQKPIMVVGPIKSIQTVPQSCPDQQITRQPEPLVKRFVQKRAVISSQVIVNTSHVDQVAYNSNNSVMVAAADQSVISGTNLNVNQTVVNQSDQSVLMKKIQGQRIIKMIKTQQQQLHQNPLKPPQDEQLISQVQGKQFQISSGAIIGQIQPVLLRGPKTSINSREQLIGEGEGAIPQQNEKPVQEGGKKQLLQRRRPINGSQV